MDVRAWPKMCSAQARKGGVALWSSSATRLRRVASFPRLMKATARGAQDQLLPWVPNAVWPRGPCGGRVDTVLQGPEAAHNEVLGVLRVHFVVWNTLIKAVVAQL